MSSLPRTFTVPAAPDAAGLVRALLSDPAPRGRPDLSARPPDAVAGEPASPAERAPRWLPGGPTGPGTSAARALLPAPEDDGPAPAPERPGPAGSDSAPAGSPGAGDPIPGLHYSPAVPADPAKVAEVDRRLEAWAHELDLFPPEWAGDFAGFQVGRAVVLQHPAAADLERLVVAGKLLVAENVVDDCYCEEEFGGSPVGLGGRLVIAQSALDPLHTADGYQQEWQEGLDADASLRAYAHAAAAFREMATPSQVTRFIHDMGRLHLGYLAEGAWAQTRTTPTVWQYLVMRQFNNFRPCLSIVDAVDGYELPEQLYSRPEVQRVTALACNATTLVNDLYSFTKEMAVDEHHLNLPVVLAAEDGTGLKEAYLKAVGIHNEIMHAFEDEAAVLAAQNPVLARYTTSLAAWVSGNHEWHRTNTYRYSLPHYW